MARRISLFLFAGIFIASTAAMAQTSGASLTGTVRDENGGALPGVTVTATNDDTGFSRSTITGANGTYHFPSLPAGMVDIVAELAGFTTVTTQKVVLNVASERQVDVKLKRTPVQEEITVTAETPLIETTSAVSAVVSRREIENLPLNGRQFANLGSLAPGTALAVNADPTKPGQLTIALNGGSGRNVSFIVDGGDNTDDTIGGALQNYSIEAVQEFSIQTQQYKAEYGRTTGGVLAVVTRTGTNEFHGSAFEFFRDESLNAKTETELRGRAGKPPYRRDQYGASLGGPVVRDRAHFFVAAERTDRRTSYVIDTGGIYTEFDGRAVATPFKDDLLTAKATGDVNARQFLQLRYGYQRNSDKYGASPIVLPSALGTITNNYHSILAGHTWQVSASTFNDFVFQNSHFKNAIAADSNEPTLLYPSGVSAGQSVNAPQSTVQHKRQFKDDVAWSHTFAAMRHDLKAGINHIDEPVLGGDFSVGLAGQYMLAADRRGAPVKDITIFVGFSGNDTPIEQTSVYLQDDIHVNAKLTLNVGLRYDLWKGFDLDQRGNPIWQTLSSQTKYNEAYLRDFQGGNGGRLENDTNNWGPRLGFTWDAGGDGTRIVRGGAGRFFDFPYTNATILFPAAAVQSSYGVVYNHHNDAGIRNADGTFFQPGQPLPPNQLTQADVPPPNEIASPTLATPYSDQLSIGYSWQINPWLGVNADASHIEYRDIPYRFRANPIDPATGARRFPAFGDFRIWYGNGKARYNGLNLGGRVRLGQRLELQGFYTISQATGNVLAGADEFRLTAANHQPDFVAVRDQSVNPYNPQCDLACFGPLNTDARHRATISGIVRVPYEVSVSGVFRYRSATPYTEWYGVDLNRDGNALDLPPGVAHVNARRGASFSQFDVRVAKSFEFAGRAGLEIIGELFNVFNATNDAGFRGNRFVLDESGNIVPNPAFGTPSTFAGDPGQGEQRLAQLGIRISF